VAGLGGHFSTLKGDGGHQIISGRGSRVRGLVSRMVGIELLWKEVGQGKPVSRTARERKEWPLKKKPKK